MNNEPARKFLDENPGYYPRKFYLLKAQKKKEEERKKKCARSWINNFFSNRRERAERVGKGKQAENLK